MIKKKTFNQKVIFKEYIEDKMGQSINQPKSKILQYSMRKEILQTNKSGILGGVGTPMGFFV